MREMKDSGIEWVGKVPKIWSLNPIRALFDEVTEKNFLGTCSNALKFTYGSIVRKPNFDADADDYVASTILNYTVVEPGTIMLNGLNLNFDFVSQRIGLVKEKGVITSAYMAFKPNEKHLIDSEFATYLFKAYDGCKAFHNMGGGVRKILNFNEFKKYYIPLPDLNEQHHIVDYLDTQCSEIDATAEDIQKEISLLEDYKKSVINEAVTKGLNPDAEMKDSGIEGIKEIPVISKVVRLKYLVDKKITDGTHQTPEYATVDDGSPFLSSKDVRNGYIDWSNVKYITKTLHNILHKEVCCKRGDILLAKNGTTGVAALVDTDDVFDIYVTLAVIRSDKKKVLPEYLLYSINSNVTKEQFSERLVGIGVPNLHLNVIENTNIIVYEISEQQKIVKYLNEKCSCIDDAILIKKKQLEMLADYKKSLIYEYVTGKKEVPHE
ncbi:restriction endonuclease subunit S [Phascolarctobacterium succinatutens]|uniref:restriction endonuclease subunit S n=1 Tax=Phascolarctobacterium succinatutens TaxID=626940 RepID=UPI0026395698|nr:restriction endonuclease subunit S [uncultured Phascolarctobacterium sp.]